MGYDRKLTIITPVFNAEKDIESCILNVVGQSFSNKEHLIVDGASTDCTLEIVKQYAFKYPHIAYISEKDFGIYDAMNKGIELARGEWIYFMGCDDELFSTTTLEEIFNINDVDKFDVVYGNVVWGDTNRIYDGKFSLLKLMTDNICHQSILYKKSLFDEYGKYDTNYKLLADHAFNMMLFNSDRVKIKYIDNIVAKYGISGVSAAGKDDNFAKDKSRLLKKYFPIEYYELYCKLTELEDCIVNNNKEIERAYSKVNRLEEQLNKLFLVNWRIIMQKIKKLFAYKCI